MEQPSPYPKPPPFSPPSPSRSSGPLSKFMGGLFAIGFLFILFSMMIGIVVGFIANAATGLSAQVQHIVGAALLVVSLLAGGTALLFIAQSLSMRPAARSPKRDLVLYQMPQGHAIEVSGTITNSPTYLAPLSQRLCVLWHVALLERQSVGDEASHWVAVWLKSRIPDVTIQYDRTRTIGPQPNVQPGAVKDEYAIEDAPGGTITIPSGVIRPTLISGGRSFPPTPENLLLLDQEGLPAELQQASATSRSFYELREFCLTTNDFVRGTQRLQTAPDHQLPDPTTEFEMSSISQERANVQMCGCLAAAFLAGALALLALGLLLVHPIPR